MLHSHNSRPRSVDLYNFSIFGCEIEQFTSSILRTFKPKSLHCARGRWANLLLDSSALSPVVALDIKVVLVCDCVGVKVGEIGQSSGNCVARTVFICFCYHYYGNREYGNRYSGILQYST